MQFIVGSRPLYQDHEVISQDTANARGEVSGKVYVELLCVLRFIHPPLPAKEQKVISADPRRRARGFCLMDIYLGRNL